MNEKKTRQRTLLGLLEGRSVGSQEEIQALLHEKGLSVTQATLSRDLKELGIVKVHRAGKGYSYMPLRNAPSPVETSTAGGHLLMGVRSLEISGQLAVVKTGPGFASVVASLIDNSLGNGVMGTVAGDDTLLVLLRKHEDRDSLLAGLQALIPGIEAKLV